MPDSTADITPPPARPLNRWGIGSLAVFQTVLLAVVLITLNYLSIHHYSRADLSRTSDYSLSPATRRYLESDALRSRAAPVRWIMIFRRASPFYERVRAICEEYARLSGGKIYLEIIDPMRDADRVQQVTAAYGLSLVRDLIIIDARSDDSAVTTEDATRTKTLNPHVKLAVADELAIHATADGQRRITGFQGEDVLTARLVESIEGRPKRMALLADKSRIGGNSGSALRKSLENTLRFQNVQLEELKLAGLKEIPDGISGIVIAAPKYDLTADEAAVLENYWNQPRAAILTLIDAGTAPPKLRAFLRSNGVTPRQDRVIARNKKGLVTSARGTFTPGVDFTRDLAGQTTEFGGASSSLEVRENAEDLVNRRIYPVSLLQVENGFWGETRFGQGDEKFDEMEDHAGPLFLAAAVTRGAQADDRFAAGTSRMVVISNTDFLAPKNHRAENLDFLASSVNWLVGREELAGIGPRSLGTYKLPLLDAQVSFINRVNLFFMPAALLLVGAFVWSSRRS